jgi:hypothetical protein
LRKEAELTSQGSPRKEIAAAEYMGLKGPKVDIAIYKEERSDSYRVLSNRIKTRAIV